MRINRLMFVLPWSLLLVIFMAITAITHQPMNGLIEYIFFGLGLFVLMIEFSRSTDIRPGLFLIDLIGSILSISATSVLFTLMITKFHTDISFHYYFGAAVIIADALLSPYNGFRTALRNFGLSQAG